MNLPVQYQPYFDFCSFNYIIVSFHLKNCQEIKQCSLILALWTAEKFTYETNFGENNFVTFVFPQHRRKLRRFFLKCLFSGKVKKCNHLDMSLFRNFSMHLNHFDSYCVVQLCYL